MTADIREGTRKRAIAYLPDVELLRERHVEQWAERFADMCGRSPTELVLPAVSIQGLAFDSQYCDWSDRLSADNLLPRWANSARAELGGPDFPIWALVDPVYAFMSNDMIAVRDQWNRPLDGNACIANPQVLSLTERLVVELTAVGVDRIVLDVTDIYPNTSSALYRGQARDAPADLGLQNTCFCGDCLALLQDLRWGTETKQFRGERNISRLILRPTTSGADHIDVPRRWLKTQDAEGLVAYAKERGFIARDDPYARQDAEQLLKYLNARGEATARALSRITERVRSAGIGKIAVVMGAQDFDISQCCDLDYLVKRHVGDEYWLPDVDLRDTVPELPIVQFLASRGPYYHNGFFENFAWLRDLAGAADDKVAERIVRNLRQVRPVDFTKGSRTVSELFEGLRGFVGIPLTQEDLLSILRQLKVDSPGLSRFIDSLERRVELGQSSDTQEGGNVSGAPAADVFQQPA